MASLRGRSLIDSSWAAPRVLAHQPQPIGQDGAGLGAGIGRYRLPIMRTGAGRGRGPAQPAAVTGVHCSTAAAALSTAPHCSLVSVVSVDIDVSRHRPTLAVSHIGGCVHYSAGCSSSSVPTFEAATTHQPRQPRPGHHSKLGQGHQLMRTR